MEVIELSKNIQEEICSVLGGNRDTVQVVLDELSAIIDELTIGTPVLNGDLQANVEKLEQLLHLATDINTEVAEWASRREELKHHLNETASATRSSIKESLSLLEP